MNRCREHPARLRRVAVGSGRRRMRAAFRRQPSAGLSRVRGAVWALSGHSDDGDPCRQVLLYGLALLRLMTVVERCVVAAAALACRARDGAVAAADRLAALYADRDAGACHRDLVLRRDRRFLRAAAAARGPIGIALIAATFIRLDGIFLCVPVAVAAFLLHRPVEAIRRGAIAAVVVALPLAGWAVRNIAVGLPSVFPSRWCSRKNAPAPYGYMHGATPGSARNTSGWAGLWPVSDMNYATIKIDDKAYDSAEEKANASRLACRT